MFVSMRMLELVEWRVERLSQNLCKLVLVDTTGLPTAR
jgi:hypothetical protein